MENLMRKQSGFAENLLNSCAVATFVIDLDHRVVLWNKSCEQMTGIPANEVIGTKNHWMAFYDNPRPCLSDAILDGRIEEIINRDKAYKKSALLPNGIRSEDWSTVIGGERKFIIVDASPIFDDDHHLVGAIETLQDVTIIKQLEEEKNQLISELRQALGRIKTLRGLLPICAACKKIRDDKGYWNKLENYIEAHSDVELKHSLCPACEERFYLRYYKEEYDEE